ncbi:MAG TPA: hypothetical protein VLS48_06715 [Anaerolineales bacterium]|nr:hypothetical protein [Anaerolineales bacterium]
MLSHEERLLIGLQALERLRPRLKARQATLDRRADLPLPNDPEAHTSPAVAPTRTEATASLDAPARLTEVIAATPPLAPNTLIFGLCEDQLPFLLDLTNPAPGALLVIADSETGNRRFLDSVLHSVGLLNTSEQVAFYILAPRPESFGAVRDLPNCQATLPVTSADASGLIDTLERLSDLRKRSAVPGPTQVLIIHDLAACLEALDEQTFAQLYRLVKHGPRARVWIIASLTSDQAVRVDERLLWAFRTRLLGRISDGELVDWIAGQPACPAASLEDDRLYCAPFGDAWLRFWVCEAEDDQNFDDAAGAENESGNVVVR